MIEGMSGTRWQCMVSRWIKRTVFSIPILHAYTLSIDDASRVLGQSPDAVCRAIHAGVLPHILVRGETAEYRLLPEDVLEFMARPAVTEVAQASNGHHVDRLPQTTAGSMDPQTAAAPDAMLQLGADLDALLQTLLEQITAPLRDLNDRLVEENGQLQSLAQQQLEALAAQRQAHARQIERLLQLPSVLEAQASRINALHAELEQVRQLHIMETEQSYRAALQGLEHRPWWMRVPNLG